MTKIVCPENIISVDPLNPDLHVASTATEKYIRRTLLGMDRDLRYYISDEEETDEDEDGEDEDGEDEDGSVSRNGDEEDIKSLVRRILKGVAGDIEVSYGLDALPSASLFVHKLYNPVVLLALKVAVLTHTVKTLTTELNSQYITDRIARMVIDDLREVDESRLASLEKYERIADMFDWNKVLVDRACSDGLITETAKDGACDLIDLRNSETHPTVKHTPVQVNENTVVRSKKRSRHIRIKKPKK